MCPPLWEQIHPYKSAIPNQQNKAEEGISIKPIPVHSNPAHALNCALKKKKMEFSISITNNAVAAAVFLTFFAMSCAKYEPNWNSIDSRPLPDWFDEGKIGIFMHWGVFSVLGLQAWFWEKWKTGHDNASVEFMKENFKPDITYPDLAADFTTEFFKPDEWAKLFKAAGAK